MSGDSHQHIQTVHENGNQILTMKTRTFECLMPHEINMENIS